MPGFAARSIRRRRQACSSRAMTAIPAIGGDERARWRSSRRASASSGRRRRRRPRIRAGWGVFYDTPHLFFNTRFANNPPWGAQITLTNPPGGSADPYLGYPGGNPFPALDHRLAERQPFPAAGVYVNAPLDTDPTSLQQWNVSAQRQFGDWLLAASYLGNHSSHLWRATELNPAVFAPGATTGNTNSAAGSWCRNPAEGAVLRHHRPGRRHRPRQLSRHAAVGAAPAARTASAC